MCLPKRCLAMDVRSGSAVPASCHMIFPEPLVPLPQVIRNTFRKTLPYFGGRPRSAPVQNQFNVNTLFTNVAGELLFTNVAGELSEINTVKGCDL
jgi:hypothetical protein